MAPMASVPDPGVQGLHIDGRLRIDLRGLPEHPGRTLKKLVTPLLDLVRMHVKILRQLNQSLLAPDRSYRHSIVGKTVHWTVF